MKQIDEIPSQNQNKLFETPQKKQKHHKRHEQFKINDVNLLDIDCCQKFDLGSSPRFIGSTQINPHASDSMRRLSASQSLQKNYSPILIKIEQKEQIETPEKYLYERSKRNYIESTYGDLNMQGNFMRCYIDLIRELKNEENPIMIPTPQIFWPHSEEEGFQYSQLVTFNLNPKNSRKLVFDEQKLTLTSVFQCLGCKVQFGNPSALGGHLSRCCRKEEHYEKLQEYYQSCEIIQEEVFNKEKSNKIDKEDFNLIKTPKKRQIFRENEKESPCFFSSSESKSISKSVGESEKHDFDNSIQSQSPNASKDEISEQNEKTLKKISRRAFIPNKSRGKNKKIFKFTKNP